MGILFTRTIIIPLSIAICNSFNSKKFFETFNFIPKILPIEKDSFRSAKVGKVYYRIWVESQFFRYFFNRRHFKSLSLFLSLSPSFSLSFSLSLPFHLSNTSHSRPILGKVDNSQETTKQKSVQFWKKNSSIEIWLNRIFLDKLKKLIQVNELLFVLVSMGKILFYEKNCDHKKCLFGVVYVVYCETALLNIT